MEHTISQDAMSVKTQYVTNLTIEPQGGKHESRNTNRIIFNIRSVGILAKKRKFFLVQKRINKLLWERNL